MATVFLTGATGFLGRNLATELLRRGHRVRALVRPESRHRLLGGCECVVGDPLNSASYQHQVAPADPFIHLVGVSHPSPSKAAEFQRVDLVSAKAGVQAAQCSGIGHFVYISVAHPAPVMKAYIEARTQAEEAIRAARLNATILRPWYVLGPGRRWPAALAPIYGILSWLPPTRESARRLGLVTLPQMIGTLADAVEQPAKGVRIVEVPQIRAGKLSSQAE